MLDIKQAILLLSMIQIQLKEPPNSPSKYGKNDYNKNKKKKPHPVLPVKTIIARKKPPPPSVSPVKTIAAMKKGTDKAGTSEKVLADMMKKRKEEDEGLEQVQNESIRKNIRSR
jgi:hypothetical protein